MSESEKDGYLQIEKLIESFVKELDGMLSKNRDWNNEDFTEHVDVSISYKPHEDLSSAGWIVTLSGHPSFVISSSFKEE